MSLNTRLYGEFIQIGLMNDAAPRVLIIIRSVANASDSVRFKWLCWIVQMGLISMKIVIIRLDLADFVVNRGNDGHILAACVVGERRIWWERDCILKTRDDLFSPS